MTWPDKKMGRLVVLEFGVVGNGLVVRFGVFEIEPGPELTGGGADGFPPACAKIETVAKTATPRQEADRNSIEIPLWSIIGSSVRMAAIYYSGNWTSHIAMQRPQPAAADFGVPRALVIRPSVIGRKPRCMSTPSRFRRTSCCRFSHF